VNRLVAIALPAAALLAAGTAAAAAPAPPRAGAGAGPGAERLAALERSVLALSPQLLALERMYLRESDTLATMALERQFSDAELLFLIGEYERAAGILHHLVDEPRFRMGPHLASARYLLGESLYQQRNFRGARRHFRDQLLSGGGPEAQLGLVRFLELSERYGDFTGVDQVFDAVLAGDGARRPERIYAVAKGTFRRTDLPAEDRLRRAEELFASLRGSRFEPRALYFEGVIAVERRQFDLAIERFRAVLKAAPADQTGLRELAELGLARVFYEQGQWDEALAQYGKIGKDSPHYADALFETAWTHAKKGDAEGALRTADVLLVLSEGTPAAPEARLLQARLCARTGRYAEAAQLYARVAKEIGPVRDKVLESLSRQEDPAGHFDRLLRDRTDEIESADLLPEEAVGYAAVGREVERAIVVARDLAASAEGLAEARKLAEELLAKVAQSDGREASPSLAEGIGRASEALAAAARAKEELFRLEASFRGGGIPGDLAAVRGEAGALETNYALPAGGDGAEYRQRARVAEVETAVLSLGAELSSLEAGLRGLGSRLADPRRNPALRTADATVAWELRVEEDRARQLRAQYDALRRDLAMEGGSGPRGDDAATVRYRDVLSRERNVAARYRQGLPPAWSTRFETIHRALDEASIRLFLARQRLGELVLLRAAELREAVAAEVRRLDALEAGLAGVQEESRGIVGRMAYETVKRVGEDLEDLAVQADAGLADVAWTRKRQRSDAIRRMAEEKDRALGDLDADLEGRAGAAP
jgi:TolA-binding protein